MKNKTPYTKLCDLLSQNHALETIVRLLEWDLETMMPKEGIHLRAIQIAELSQIIHKKKTSSAFEKALSACISLKTLKIKEKDLSKREEASLHLTAEDFKKNKKLPAKFVKELTQLKAESSQIWAKAREENRFEHFQPHLEKMIAMMRKSADYIGYDEHPYDALLDQYEPHMTVKTLDKVFKELKTGLIEITNVLFNRSKAPSEILSQTVSHDDQLKFCRSILATLGLSPDIARLDTSSHPFCNSIYSKDIRLTTSIKPHTFFNAIYSTLHECGHALYEAGLPYKDFGTPLGEACSLGIHESQSRFFETFIGQGKPFIHFLTSKLKGLLPNTDVEKMYEAINVVEPSFIRIESDEVTYCLHVMVRYELEKKLLDGSLKVKDLPKAWNELMKLYFGITPPSDKEGCLQDIHWSLGLFGYFPTYALGNLYAAQLHEKLREVHPNFDALVQSGHFEPIINWLQSHIYQYGREKTPEKLVTDATKKPLSAKPYLHYLKSKYKVS